MTLQPSASPSWELLDLAQEEQEYILFSSVTSEFNDISGFPIYYYIKQNTESQDYLYGEDPVTEYSEPFETKVLYQPSDEPEMMLDVFGMSSDETIQFTQMTKTIFSRDVSDTDPKVGDVIKTLWDNKTYEIASVTANNKVFQGMKLIWDFILRPYRHSNESDSAEDMLFENISSDDFPDINISTESKELSAYGDNKDIEDESYSDPDAAIYGYK